MTKRTFIFAAFIAFLNPNTQAEESIDIAKLNDVIAFLAGLDLPHQVDHPLTEASSWQSHIEQIDREFSSHEERVLRPISNWSAAALQPDMTTGSTVRYLFSGPDIIHAFYMFPTANTYIMCGLEPIGETPDLSQLNGGNAGRALSEVRNALGEIINFSFFRTKDMKDDLQFSTFHGTTPIMMIFLARSGQYVKSLEYLSLNTDGTLASQGAKSSGADVVKIEFSPRRLQQSKTLYYFSSDLSDGGFAKSGLQKWLEGQPTGNAYLKAASFLMHSSWFSKVRQHLLDYSDQIVQDDSGIPFRYFDADVWFADLYGSYTGPIELFAENYQGDLRSAYQKQKKPLDFGTGYKWRKGESNLMRLVKAKAFAKATKSRAEEEPAITPETNVEKSGTEDPASAQ
tara:strand:- start:5586 stop:6782 length:1197 start_codon:yes stop_codon:yes gene_type:complete